MPNENETEASGKDALNAYESLFGGEEPGANDVVTKEQDAKTETGQDKRGSQVSDDRGGPDESVPAEEQTDDDKASPTEDLKVVLAIKDGRATIGVQGPSSDPHIESFDGPDLSGLAQEVPAVIERARARWEDEPKYPAHARSTPSTRGRGRREQSSAKDSTAEGDAAQPQPETLKLF